MDSIYLCIRDPPGYGAFRHPEGLQVHGEESSGRLQEGRSGVRWDQTIQTPGPFGDRTARHQATHGTTELSLGPPGPEKSAELTPSEQSPTSPQHSRKSSPTATEST